MERVIGHHNFSWSWETPASRPNTISTFDRHRKYRHLRFHRQPHSARFEPIQISSRRAPPSFRKNHHRASITQPLQRASYRGRIASFQRQRPGSKPRQTSTDKRPAKRRTPRQITRRSFDRNRKPERIDVCLMIRGDDQATILGHVLKAVEFNLEQNTTQRTDYGPDRIKCPLRQRRTLRRCSRILSFCLFCTVVIQYSSP